MDADLEELAAIIELLDKTEFTQFRFEKGDLSIAVSRGEPLTISPATAPASGPTATAPAGSPAAPATAAKRDIPAPASSDLASDELLVRSPMLGTFYGAPKPGEPAFVQEGQEVAADSVLCIIEVMKLMNSVSAGESGVVRRILVGDGELVEFDQPLFVLGPAS